MKIEPKNFEKWRSSVKFIFMIICICHGITDKKIHQLIEEGAHEVRKISRSCGAGNDCGSCVLKLKKLLEEEAAKPSLPKSED